MSSYQTARSSAPSKKRGNGTINCLADFFFFFFRLVQMKMLAGLCLSAVLQLLTVCHARCVTRAFQLRRSSCMPCTAMASGERRLARTVQVCQALLLCVCSLCSSPFPVTWVQVLQSCPSRDIWCVAWHVGRFVHSAFFHLQAGQESVIGSSCVSSTSCTETSSLRSAS